MTRFVVFSILSLLFSVLLEGPAFARPPAAKGGCVSLFETVSAAFEQVGEFRFPTALALHPRPRAVAHVLTDRTVLRQHSYSFELAKLDPASFPELEDGIYLYVINRSGQGRFINQAVADAFGKPYRPNQYVAKHDKLAALLDGSPLVAAGHFTIRGGRVIGFSNGSGAYRGFSEHLEFAEDVFRKAGLKIDENTDLMDYSVGKYPDPHAREEQITQELQIRANPELRALLEEQRALLREIAPRWQEVDDKLWSWKKDPALSDRDRSFAERASSYLSLLDNPIDSDAFYLRRQLMGKKRLNEKVDETLRATELKGMLRLLRKASEAVKPKPSRTRAARNLGPLPPVLKRTPNPKIIPEAVRDRAIMEQFVHQYDLASPGAKIPRLKPGIHIYLLSKRGKVLIVDRVVADAKGMALDPDHYIADHDSLRLFLEEGDELVAAGEITVRDGKVKFVSNRSGKYRGDQVHLDYAKVALKEAGVKITPDTQIANIATGNYPDPHEVVQIEVRQELNLRSDPNKAALYRRIRQAMAQMHSEDEMTSALLGQFGKVAEQVLSDAYYLVTQWNKFHESEAFAITRTLQRLEKSNFSEEVAGPLTEEISRKFDEILELIGKTSDSVKKQKSPGK